VTIDPVPYSSSEIGPSSASTTSSSSPKRSWFGHLFSFKAPSATLLAHDNIGNTRERTKRLLTDFGVKVAVVEMDGVRALKCRLDEIKGEGPLSPAFWSILMSRADPQGTMTVVKGVRFKVEFSRSTPSGGPPSNGAGYNTLVSMTQEKGAQSAFKSEFLSTYVPPPSSLVARQWTRLTIPSQQYLHNSNKRSKKPHSLACGPPVQHLCRRPRSPPVRPFVPRTPSSLLRK